MEKKRNLWVIPTDKPSRLLYSKIESSYEFVIKQTPSECNDGLLSGQRNIYITSDEEIKEGDWYLYCDQINKRIRKNPKAEYPYPNYRKILLTTDPKLIEDGVQAIDNEFLEWFVKNPSCEWIDVENYKWSDYPLNYKIIIPKEEPKQENFEDVLDKCLAGAKVILEELRVRNAKQETLEEAAERYAANWEEITGLDSDMVSPKEASEIDFIAGAKWQDKWRYSKEDMKEAIRFGFDKGFCSNSSNKVKNLGLSEREWFEQYKKK